MSLEETLIKLPKAEKVVIILSGGMDSTISMRLLVEKYGRENVFALTFDYGQKQKEEINRARDSTRILGVTHKVLDLSVLGELSRGFSANTDKDIVMPTIKEVLGDPRPKTYVPNRNMILLSLAASYAEVNGATVIVTGLQVNDEYSYWDCTHNFVEYINGTLGLNRNTRIRVEAPFIALSKQDEINLLLEMDGNVNLLAHTLTCYNPNALGQSCGKCPSCAERIANFAKVGTPDVINYYKEIPWERLITSYQEKL